MPDKSEPAEIARKSPAEEAEYAGELLLALAKARGLQSVIEAGYKALGNPIMVFSDKTWKSIAFTPNIEIPDDPVWTEFTKTGTLSLEIVTRNVHKGLDNRIEDSRNLVILEGEDPKIRRLMARVLIGGRPAAMVAVIEREKKFEERDLIYLSMLRDAISAELQKDKFLSYARGMPYEELIESLLEGDTKNPARIADRLKSISPRQKEFAYIFVLDVRGFDSKHESMPYVRNYLENLISGSRAVIYNNNVVLLADYEKDDEQYERDVENLRDFLHKNNMRCGISRRFTELSELRVHYFEAMEALDIGIHMDKEKNIYRYDSYAIYHIAKKCLYSNDPVGFMHPKLKELVEYDDAHNSGLTESLYVYLRCQRNITNAASALHLHRNTLIYHLKRIEEILGIRLSGRDVLLHMELSFRFLEFDRKIEVKDYPAFQGEEPEETRSKISGLNTDDPGSL